MLHFHRNKVYAHTGGVFTLCGMWKCGSPEEVAETAIVYDTLDSILDGQDGMPSTEEPVLVSEPEVLTD